MGSKRDSDLVVTSCDIQVVGGQRAMAKCDIYVIAGEENEFSGNARNMVTNEWSLYLWVRLGKWYWM